MFIGFLIPYRRYQFLELELKKKANRVFFPHFPLSRLLLLTAVSFNLNMVGCLLLINFVSLMPQLHQIF